MQLKRPVLAARPGNLFPQTTCVDLPGVDSGQLPLFMISMWESTATSQNDFGNCPVALKSWPKMGLYAMRYCNHSQVN